MDGSIARGNEALTLLDNYQTRNEFMNDILEVGYYENVQFIYSYVDIIMLLF